MSAEAEGRPLRFNYLATTTNRDGFRCGVRDVDDWFRRKALKAHQEGSVVVVCAVDPALPRRPIGFHALATVAEETRRLPIFSPKHRIRSGDYFSALQLVWLGVDRGFRSRGLGTRMVSEVLRTFVDVGPKIGLPTLIVVPHPDNYERLSSFYRALDFEEYADGGTMFLPLQRALQVRVLADDDVAVR